MPVEVDDETRRYIKRTAAATAERVIERGREATIEAARSAARDTLIDVGIDPSDPLEAQRTSAALRDIARLAPALGAIARHYEDSDNVEALKFARSAHKLYKSGKARATAGIGAAIWLAITTGLIDFGKAIKKLIGG